MRLGLTSAAFYGRMETEDAAQKLRDFPLDTCEMFLETHGEYNLAFGELLMQRLCGLHCRSIHAKGTQFEGDLFGASPRQRADAFQIFAGVLDCGMALGANVYVFHGLPDFKGGLTIDRIPRLRESITQMMDMAFKRGLMLAWENVSWCALKRPEDAAYLMSLFPDLRFTLDIKQARLCGVDPLSFLPVMGDRLIHVHVLDYDAAGHHCLPGHGLFDFHQLRQGLLRIGYQGDVILEPYAAQALDEKALRVSISYLRSAFDMKEPN